MNALLDALSNAIAAASELEVGLVRGQLAEPKKREMGDVAFPCFDLAKRTGTPPPVAAAKLLDSLGSVPGVAGAEVAGGFLNFRLDRAMVAAGVLTAYKAPEAKELGPVIVEYSSPNIAKPFHVGHLRATLVGHAVAQGLIGAGYPVIRVNHLGDWGTQFGFVYAGCKIWGRPKNASVDSLVEVYQKATSLRNRQAKDQLELEDLKKPDVNAMAREYFKRLEGGDPEARAFWQWCLDVSMDYFLEAYQELGVQFDHFMGESFYENRLPEVERLLKESGILTSDQGALGVDLGEELGFARIFAEDGRSLYITRDLAAAMYREEAFKPSRILYVVGSQQVLHFRQLKAILERLGHPVAPKVVHVPFGFVPGMSTREGGVISLKSFLGEARDRAAAAYEGVKRESDQADGAQVSNSVAIGATFFYFLNHTNVKDFQFRWDEALNFQGDTGPYLQYAVARINSIEEKAREAGILPAIDPAHLGDDASWEMIRRLGEFESLLEDFATELEPVKMCAWLLDLARAFMKGYQELRVIGAEPEVAAARLGLFAHVREALSRGMGLLGVPVLERM